MQNFDSVKISFLFVALLLIFFLSSDRALAKAESLPCGVLEAWTSIESRLDLDLIARNLIANGEGLSPQGSSAIRDGIAKSIQADVIAECGANCHPLNAKSFIVKSLAKNLMMLGSRTNEFLQNRLPTWQTTKRVGVGTLLFLSGAAASSYMNVIIIDFVKLHLSGTYEVAIIPALNSITGMIFGVTGYVFMDMLNSKGRAITGKLIQTKDAMQEANVEQSIIDMSVAVQARTNAVDGRVAGVFGSLNAYDTTGSIALVSARQAGETGDHNSAYNIIAGLAVNTQQRQKQIDPDFEFPFIQVSPIIATYAKARIHEIHPQVLARITLLHQRLFKRNPSAGDMETFYKPFLKKLLEPAFSADQSQIDKIIADNPSWAKISIPVHK